MQTQDLHRYIAKLTENASPDDVIAVFAWTLAEQSRAGHFDRAAFKGRFISAFDGAWRVQEATKRIAA